MEDLIYGLLVFAWVAYGIYKGLNSKKNSQKKPLPQNHQFSHSDNTQKAPDLEAIFNQLFDIPKAQHAKTSHPYEAEVVKKTPRKPVQSEKHAKPTSLDSYTGSDYAASSLKHVETVPNGLGETYEAIDYQYDYVEEQNHESEVDLRQAVIHQAILSRPY